METNKVKILVVDDEEEICAVTSSFLAKRNFNVITATNKEEALKLVTDEHPALMLLDVRLGEDSGMDVLAKVKEIDKRIKVIMVTALGDEESIRQAKSLGADDYIAKPFTAAFLNNLLAQKVAGFKLQAEPNK